MSRWVFLYVAAAALIGGAGDEQTAQMRRVLSMVRAAHAPSRSLMPWAGPVEEVERVARHGKAVVPLLIVLLPEDPDDPDLFYDHWSEQDIMAGRQFDWHVEQQAATALCRIYRRVVNNADCPRYDNRASRETNRRVRAFWLKTIAENP